MSIEDHTITIKKQSYNNLIKGIVISMIIVAFFGGYFVATIMYNFNNESTQTKLVTQIIEELKNNKSDIPNLVFTFSDDTQDDPVLGSQDSHITIIEFSDFECPFCSKFHQQTLPLLRQNYIDTGDVKLVYRDFPLSFHANAMIAHIASGCADEQNSFWDYHDILFDRQSQWQSNSLAGDDNIKSQLIEYASELKLDITSFESCMESPYILQEINQDISDAKSKKVSGTPTFFIGTEQNGFTKLVGAQPYDSFKRIIDDTLNEQDET